MDIFLAAPQSKAPCFASLPPKETDLGRYPPNETRAGRARYGFLQIGVVFSKMLVCMSLRVVRGRGVSVTSGRGRVGRIRTAVSAGEG